MTNYQISIHSGCDEVKTIDFELDQHEVPVLYEIAGLLNADGRFPALRIKRIN